MAQESGQNQQRIPIPYFEGVNSTVQHVIAKKTELAHMENARAPIIGVLEKREGQAVIGTDVDGGVFEALGNFGLVYWVDGGNESQGLFRITTVNGTSCNIYFLSTSYSPTANETLTMSESVTVVLYTTSLFDTISITESVTMLIILFGVNLSDSVNITESVTLSIV